ncbi:tape measure protein [Bacteroides sp.]|uniref:tape measure protein n=1 Tax=Bacteroides sp. TaxID=29523 RepID=UPI00261CE4E2|nr:tape measure protein [Bacteroides sp.]MDD3040084.1 tape measure protein [Bacteroides sp.]
MRFDNKQFESGVQATIKSLTGLRDGLNLEASTKNLQNLDKAGRAFSLEGIASGVDAINAKFSALGIAGITALMNITNSALNAGKRITSALTIDPIKTGFQEYETKMNAIQTILTNTKSKGTTIDDVNEALAELNTYADKTIYNFSEMTRNIGTFTAAGVDLDTSVKSIKGIANLAAGSGSTAVQASTAMYQLSQAIGSGVVRLQDWNSVQNAGMGGELFQNALKDTAKSMGIVVDESKLFRDTLKDEWLTSEVLTKTLSKMADDKDLLAAAQDVKTITQLFDTMKESVQSGWAVSWEHIIGNKNEATETLTAVSDAFNNIVGPAADARNASLAFWHDNGGREALIKGLSNAFKGLQSIMKPIRDGFKEIFPSIIGKRLIEITEQFRDLTAKFKMESKTISNIKATAKGIFSILDIGRMALVNITKVAFTLASNMTPIVSGLLNITGALGRFATAISDALKKSETFTGAIDAIKKVLAPSVNGIGELLKSFGDALSELGSIDIMNIENLGPKLKTAFSPVIAIFDLLSVAFDKMMPLLSNASKTVLQAITKFVDKITDELLSIDFQTVISLLNGALMAGILKGVKDFIKQFSDLTGSGKSIIDGFSGILDGVRGSLESYQKNLQAKTLMTIATSIAILAGSLVALSLIDSNKLDKSLETLTVLFAEMFISSGIFGKVLGASKIVGATKTIITIQGLAIAVLILAKALDEISVLDWGQISKGIVTITLLSAVLAQSAKTIGTNAKGLSTAAFGLIGFAIAINLLAKAVGKLGEMDVPVLVKGLGSIAVLIAEIVLFMKYADLDKTGPLKSLALIGMAVALNIFAVAVSAFGNMTVKEIGKCLMALSGVLTALAIFVNTTGNSTGVISTAIGLTILGGAMLIFGKAMSNIGSLPLSVIAKGLGAMSIALFAISKTMMLMPPNLIGSAVGLTILSIALIGLSGALKILGEMSLEEIGRGLLALGGSLVILAVGMNYMSTGLVGAVAMTVMAGAIALLVPSLLLLSSVPLMGLVAGLSALAGVFVIVGVATVVLAPMTVTMLALATAIGVLGLGFLAVGGGMMLFATGIALLANNLALFVTALATAITDTVKIIPQLFNLISESLKALAKVIGEAAPDIVKALVILLESMIEAVSIAAPKIIDLFIKLLIDILTALESALPQIVESGGNIIISLLQGLAQKLPDIVTAAADLIVKFIEGLNANLEKLVNAGFDFIISFLNGISNAIETKSAAFGSAMGRLVGAIVSGLVNGLLSALKEIGKAGAAMGKSALDGTAEELEIHSPSKAFDALGVFSGKGYINGLKSTQPELLKTTKSVFQNGVLAPAKDMATVMNQTMIQSGSSIKDFMSSYLGMTSKLKDTTPIMSAEEAVKAYSKQLYLETEQYKTDTEVLTEHKKELSDLTDQYSKLEKDLKKSTTKDEAKDIQSELEKVGKSIADTKTKIIQDETDIANHTKETFDNLKKSISDSVKDSIDPLKASLDTNIDLFAEFGEGTEVAVNDILSNMKSQVAGVKTWNADLDRLSESGFASGLIKQLREMGPSGSNYVKAFTKMTTEQMNTANTEFQEASKMTASTLISNFDDSLTAAKKWAEDIQSLSKTGLQQGIIEALGKMGMDGAEYVTSFMNMTPEQIDEFNKQYEEYLTLPDSVSNSVMQSFMTAGSKAAIKFAEAVKSTTNPESEEGKVLTETSTKLGSDTVSNVVTGMTTEAEALKAASSKLGEVVFDGFNTYLSEAKGKLLGGYICDGLIIGLSNNKNSVIDSAKAVAKAAYDAAKDELGIESPSKAFEEIGMYSDKGMAVGLRKFAGLVSTEAKAVGVTAVSALQTSISKVSDLLKIDFDNLPVIKPVLDLTNIKAGNLELNSLLSGDRSISLSSTIDKTGVVSSGMTKTSVLENQNGTIVTAGSTYKFEQNIYSPKPVSRIDLYRHTKNLLSVTKG